jgi:hypothetical protein
MVKKRDDVRDDLVVGWPPYLDIRRAAAYTGVSRYALDRAVKDGRLSVAGQRGNRKIFSRAALDAFVVGQTSIGPVPISDSLHRLRATTSRKAR